MRSDRAPACCKRASAELTFSFFRYDVLAIFSLFCSICFLRNLIEERRNLSTEMSLYLEPARFCVNLKHELALHNLIL